MSVHTFDIKSKVTRKMQVPMDADGYIPRIRFTHDPNKLAIITLNRHQNRLDMYFGDPRSTVCKQVLRDESDAYIKEAVFDNIIFYPENFSFVSEKSGYNHLYWYSMGGNLLKQVTAGNYEVKDFLGWDADDNSFYFTSNEESPLRKAVYKIDRKRKKTKLSTQPGINTAQFSTNMKYYMNRYSNLSTPTVITLNDNAGKVLSTLVTNDNLKKDPDTIQRTSKGIFYLPDSGRSNFEWLDDETYGFLRIQEISCIAVSIQRSRFTTSARHMEYQLGNLYGKPWFHRGLCRRTRYRRTWCRLRKMHLPEPGREGSKRPGGNSPVYG